MTHPTNPTPAKPGTPATPAPEKKDARIIVRIDQVEFLKDFKLMRVDRKRNRFYYASQRPRFILRCQTIQLEEIEVGDCYEARVTLDEGTHTQYVRAGNAGQLHTAVTLRRQVDARDGSRACTPLTALWLYACARDAEPS